MGEFVGKSLVVVTSLCQGIIESNRSRAHLLRRNSQYGRHTRAKGDCKFRAPPGPVENNDFQAIVMATTITK